MIKHIKSSWILSRMDCDGYGIYQWWLLCQICTNITDLIYCPTVSYSNYTFPVFLCHIKHHCDVLSLQLDSPDGVSYTPYSIVFCTQVPVGHTMVSLRISIYFTQKHRNMITIWCSTCSRNRHYVMMSTHVLPSVWKKLYPVPICTHRSLSPQLVLKKFCTHGYIYDAFGRWSASSVPYLWCDVRQKYVIWVYKIDGIWVVWRSYASGGVFLYASI